MFKYIYYWYCSYNECCVCQTNLRMLFPIGALAKAPSAILAKPRALSFHSSALPSSPGLFMLRYSCVAVNSNECALPVKQIVGQGAHPLCTESKLICIQCCRCEPLYETGSCNMMVRNEVTPASEGWAKQGPFISRVLQTQCISYTSLHS